MGFFGRSPLLPVVTHDDGSQSDPLLVATTEEAVAAAAALRFPPGFIFGSATSAYQVEGGIVDTNWNRWEQQKTKRGGGETIRNGEEAGRACDMWNLFEDVDLPLIEKLGLGSFRFSIEWSRVEPTEGVFDDAALARYERWCTLLRARGIEPCVTLLHFTEPGWFVDQGGWEEKRNVPLFVRFCERVVRRLSPFCSMWCTLNEPVGCATARSKCPPWQRPSSAPVPPQGAPGSSGWPGAPTGETGPLSAQPLPRVLERAASKAADFPAFDPPGAINGWLVGIHPPGGQGQLRTTVRVIWHMLLGHREVSRAIREAAAPGIASTSDARQRSLTSGAGGASGAAGAGGASGAGAAPCIMIANNIVWFEAKWRWNFVARLVTQLVNLAFN